MRTGMEWLGRATLVTLMVAWFGIWGAWLPHPVVGLRVNALDLAEWATFLPEVREGMLRFLPEALRLALSLAVIALGIQAGSALSRWRQWLVRALGLLPCLLMLPPYPHVLQLWWSDSYGLRFTVASFGLLGVVASPWLSRLPAMTGEIISGLLVVASAALGLGAFLMLRRLFVTYYDTQLTLGWGIAFFLAGLTLAALLHSVARSRMSQNPDIAAKRRS